jgi:2-polyprenyl-3-methyl-5-hydroxy-6-metoxy-1,4-benzoquinol methylase
MRKLRMILNKFLTKQDDICELLLPKTWWSRPFEYQFCLNQIKNNDIIIDAGCGIEHPFKNEAIRRCKKVYAIDTDPRLMDIKKVDGIEYKLGSIVESSKFVIEKVDKIFCISVLEHMSVEDVIKTLDDFSKCLKDKGNIILTVDYPTLTPQYLLKLVDSMDLEIVGKYDYEMRNNLITDGTLNVFTMVLKLAKNKEIVSSKD